MTTSTQPTAPTHAAPDRAGNRAVRGAHAAFVLVVWIGAWGHARPNVLVPGVLLAWLTTRPAPSAILLAARSARSGGALTVRPVATLRAFGALVVMLLRANVAVLLEVLRRRHPSPEGIVDVRLTARPPGVDVIVASAVTLTPGTAVLDLLRDEHGTVLRVHTLALPDAGELRAEILRIEALVAAAFGDRTSVMAFASTATDDASDTPPADGALR